MSVLDRAPSLRPTQYCSLVQFPNWLFRKDLAGGVKRVVKVKDWGRLATIDCGADGRSFWASVVRRGETTALINIRSSGPRESGASGEQAVCRLGYSFAGWQAPGHLGSYRRLERVDARGSSPVVMR